MKTAKSQSSDISDQALQILEGKGAMSVRELYDVLKVEIPSLTESVVDMVWRLSDESKAQLEDASPFIKRFTRFLALWERHLSLYGSLVLAFAATLSIYVVPADLPWAHSMGACINLKV